MIGCRTARLGLHYNSSKWFVETKSTIKMIQVKYNSSGQFEDRVYDFKDGRELVAGLSTKCRKGTHCS